MRTVEVEITEILLKKVLVQIPETASVYDAVAYVENQYGDNKLRLDYHDFVDVSFGIAN